MAKVNRKTKQPSKSAPDNPPDNPPAPAPEPESATNKGNPEHCAKATDHRKENASYRRRATISDHKRIDALDDWKANFPFLDPRNNQLAGVSDIRQLGEFGSAIALSVLIDCAAGLLPGATAAQRVDAAKELRKASATPVQQQKDPLRELLNNHGKEGVRDLIDGLRRDRAQLVNPETGNKRSLE